MREVTTATSILKIGSLKPRKLVGVTQLDWRSSAGGLGSPGVMLTASRHLAGVGRYPWPFHVSLCYLLCSVLCSRGPGSNLRLEGQAASSPLLGWEGGSGREGIQTPPP